MGAFERDGLGTLILTSNLAAGYSQIEPLGNTTNDVTFDNTTTNLLTGIYQVYPQDIEGFYTPWPKFVQVNANEEATLHFEYIPDTLGPELQLFLNGGTRYTQSPLVTIFVGAEDPVNGIQGQDAYMQFSSDSLSWSLPYPITNKHFLWDITRNDTAQVEGFKIVYARAADSQGYLSRVYKDSIYYKPSGRIIQVTLGTVLNFGILDTLQAGDILLFGDGIYDLVYSRIKAGIKLQGNGSSILNLTTTLDLEEGAVLENLVIQGNNRSILLRENRTIISNCILDGIWRIRITNNNGRPLIHNCLFKNPIQGNYIYSFNTNTIEIRNCIFDGASESGLTNKNAINIDEFSGDFSPPVIVNNIFTDIGVPVSTSPAIIIDNDDVNPGNGFIDKNNFYNTPVQISSNGPALLSRRAMELDPQFDPGTYQLSINSPLKGASNENNLYHNHHENSGDLGISGGVFYNKPPSLNIALNPASGTINSIFTFTASGTDQETPSNYLQYAWDFDNDGIIDTVFAANKIVEYKFPEYIQDSIACYVMDEHGAVDVLYTPSPLVPLPDTVPGAPVLLEPVDSATVDATNAITLMWEDIAGDSISYGIQVASEANFTNVLYEANSNTTEHLIANLPYHLSYYWRVNATNPIGTGAWSNSRLMNTEPQCDMADVQYQTHLDSDTSFQITVSFTGLNTYTITDGDSTLTGQNAGIYHFGPYSLGTLVSITIQDELASNCLDNSQALTVNPALSISGMVLKSNGLTPVPGVSVELSGDTLLVSTTGPDGTYQFDGLQYGGSYAITMSKSGIASASLTGLDIVKIEQHILNIAPFTNTYTRIAADVGENGTISGLDIFAIENVILGNWTNFQNNKVWLFIPQDFEFNDPNNWIDYETSKTINSLQFDAMNQNFIGIKLGDTH